MVFCLFTCCVFSTRLKNIEETEKAKRQVAEERKGGRKEDSVVRKDEEHLVAARCECCRRQKCRGADYCRFSVYRPHSTQQSDAEALRRAKLEAMGLSPEPDPRGPYNDGRNQMATDDLVSYHGFSVERVLSRWLGHGTIQEEDA
jgi:hypothetical protein